MEKVNITTSHNVQISYDLASVGDRILGYLIDGLVMVGYILLIFFTIGFTTDFDFTDDSSMLVFLSILLLPLALYHLLFEIFTNGQSIGKKAMKIKVVKLDGSQPTIGSYLIRWIIRPIDFSFYGAIAILCIVLGKKGQRLGDLAAGTSVVSTKIIKPFMQEHSLNFTKPEYQPHFPDNIRQLSDEQINIIKKALTLYRSEGNDLPAKSLAEKIRTQLNLQGPENAISFLELLVKDYEHYES